MPIRAELRHHYRSPAWRAARRRILERAGGKFSESGRLYLGGAKCEKCQVPDRDQVVRHTGFPGWWFTFDGEAHTPDGEKKGMVRGSEMPEPRFVTIVLTVAHLDRTPGHDDDDNLKALCQWCHLHYDREANVAHAHETRATRKDAARPLLQEAAQ